MNKKINLLGDSIIDNKSYVGFNENSVLEHLEENSQYSYLQIAKDGDTTEDLINNQLELSLQNQSTHTVLSIGGNDMLYNLPFLTSNKLFIRNEAFTDVYKEIFKPLEERYQIIVKNLSTQTSKLLLCTVYEGDLERSSEFREILNSSKIMIAVLNDIINKTASRYNADILELRNIFTSPEDFANPIEPSHIGGEKLAKKIIEWVKANEN